MLEIKDLAVQYGNQAPTIEHFNLSMKKEWKWKNYCDPCRSGSTFRSWQGHQW